MPNILVTNDDGVYSPGLLALRRELSAIAEVIVLAPERNCSAASHAKTMHKPLRVTPVTLADGTPAHSCSGSPTDCVALAAAGVLGVKPDLVVSGINNGYNLGIDITYSGTVACAMEAVIKGIPGIAVSTGIAGTGVNGDGEADMPAVWALAGRVSSRLAEHVLAHGLPPKTLLNVNVPLLDQSTLDQRGASEGMRVTRMGNRHYPAEELVERHDPWGRPYYWLGGAGPVDEPDDGTDVAAVRSGCISITPITLDLTNYAFIEALGEWTLAAWDLAAAGK